MMLMRLFECVVCFEGIKKLFVKILLVNLFSFLFFITSYSQTLSGVSEITFWLDASQGVAINADSSVLYWPNVIDASDSAFQTNSLKQPTWIAQDPLINNQSIVYFSGTSDQLYNTNQHDFGAMYIIARWSGNDVLFPDYNGLVAKYTSGDFPYLFIGRSGTTSLHPNSMPWSVSDIYINQQNTLDFSPINQYKMIYGSTPSAANFNDLVIGSSLTNSRFWEGGVAEIIGFDTIPSDSIKSLVDEYIQNKYSPPINLGPDIDKTSYCDTIIRANKKWFTNYLWQDGSTYDSLIVSETGWYSCTATDVFGFTSMDSVYVEFPIITQPTGTMFCQNDSLTWDTQLNNTDFSFLWSNASIDSLINIFQAGDYWVKVTDNFGCFKYSDTIGIVVDSFPLLTSLGLDKTICQGASIGLTSNTVPDTYLWSTTDTTPQITINTAGQYWLQSSNVNGCVNKDTINIALSGIAPTVGFTTQALCVNEPVQFTDVSTTSDGSNIVSWSWDFGDGATSTLPNPQHQYNNDATYVVTLAIQTDSGCENSVTLNIQIHQAPIAGFYTTTNPICSGAPTSFTNNSFSNDGVITGWMWDFGVVGVNDTSSLSDPDYVFPVTSNYTVQQIVTSQYNCKDTTTNIITVKAAPVASFTTGNQCLNNATTFTNTSQGNVVSVLWDFDDTNTSVLFNPSHTYAALNTYNVSLIATGLNGCFDTVVTPVTIYNNPVADFTPSDFCVLANQQLYDNSTLAIGLINDWSWDVVNHSNQSTDKDPSFLFAIEDTGTYQVNLVVTSDFGCKDSITDSIDVYPLPIPSFTFTPSIGAPPLLVNFNNLTNGSNSYFWDFGDGNTSVDTVPVHSYLDSNTYVINLIATSSKGCIDSVSKVIKVFDPVLDVAITNVSYSLNVDQNFLKISANFVNFGTFDINSIDLIAKVTAAGTILENWTGTLGIGNQMNYTFSSSIEMNNGEIPDLICVKVQRPNGGIDAVPSNNEYCISLAKFVLVSMYPNPASNVLNLEYITPREGEVVIGLYNTIGEQVIVLNKEQATKGLNRSVVNLSSFRKGVYFIEILFDGNSIKEKIVIK